MCMHCWNIFVTLFEYLFSLAFTVMCLQGDVMITVEILPKSVAALMPAGLGRSEPNAHPYLPPPTGRLKLVLLHRQ